MRDWEWSDDALNIAEAADEERRKKKEAKKAAKEAAKEVFPKKHAEKEAQKTHPRAVVDGRPQEKTMAHPQS